jgi:hypothetical protein
VVTEEPFYSYVPGKGWVATSNACETYTAKTRAGKSITIFRRPPEFGERGWWVERGVTLELIFKKQFYTNRASSMPGWLRGSLDRAFEPIDLDRLITVVVND